MSDAPAARGSDVTGIASSVVDVFRTSPILLLIVLLNMAFAGAGGYVVSQLESQRHVERMAMMERCLPDVNLQLQLFSAARTVQADGKPVPTPTHIEPRPWIKP